MTPALPIPLPMDRIADFCRRWKIAEFSFFGSVVRDDFRPDSDIDVLVTFELDAPWSAFELVAMRDELSAIFARDVDLVEESFIRNPYRRASILRDKRVLHAA